MVTAKQGLTNVKEELRLTNQTSSQLAQVLNMTLIMIHYIFARGGDSIVTALSQCINRSLHCHTNILYFSMYANLGRCKK